MMTKLEDMTKDQLLSVIEDQRRAQGRTNCEAIAANMRADRIENVLRAMTTWHDRKRGVTPAEYDGGPDNEDRADWACQALGTFMEATGVDPESAVADLICNLMHLMDREPEEYGEDFWHELANGLGHYEFETSETPQCHCGDCRHCGAKGGN